MYSSSSIADFSNSIYIEQLEGGASLCGQRLTLLSNSNVYWKEISKFEERFEANIDALVAGEDPALEVCRQQAVEGDAGELYAAVRVFCRQGRSDLFIEVLGQQNLEDKEKLQALVDALKYELPADWLDDFVSLLRTDDEQLCALVATVVGYRRIPAGRDVVQALQRNQSLPLIWAAGRLRERGASRLLLPALHHEDESVCSAAALALLRLGEQQAVDRCREIVREKSCAFIPLALGGGHSAVSLVQEIAESEQASQDVLVALGLLGDSSAAPLLMKKLEDEFAEAAALGLNLLTGAELYERVFIPDDVDEDELFPDELEAYRKEGKVPTKPDGTPYGEWVTRLSQNQEDWVEWWGRHSHLFQPGIRYRNGKPSSPACLLESLQHEKTPHRIRQLAYEELVIRYDVDFSFEADMLVSEQLRVLDEMSRWCSANAGRFQEGEWYFAGQIISG